MPTCPKSPHQVINSHMRSVMVEDWVFFVKDGLDPSVVPTKTCTTFENFLIKLSLHKESFCFLKIYKPPSSNTPTFLNSFSHFWRIFITPLKTLYPLCHKPHEKTTKKIICTNKLNIIDPFARVCTYLLRSTRFFSVSCFSKKNY